MREWSWLSQAVCSGMGNPVRRAGKLFPALLYPTVGVLGGCLLGLASGCGPKTITGDASSPVIVSAAQTGRGTTAADTAAVERIAQDYITALQQADYSHAERLMSLAARSHLPAGGLKKSSQDIYRPFIAARDIQFDEPPQSLSHGKRLVLRVRFSGEDTKSYRTNFLFDRNGSGWLIESIVPPVAPRTPRAVGGTLSSH